MQDLVIRLAGCHRDVRKIVQVRKAVMRCGKGRHVDVMKNAIELSCRGEQRCNENVKKAVGTKISCRCDECCQTDEWKAVMQT